MALTKINSYATVTHKVIFYIKTTMQNKSFSILDIFNLDYDKLQEYITLIEARNTPESSKLANILKSVPRSFFEKSDAQKKLKKVIDIYSKLSNGNEENLEALISYIYNRITQRVTEEVVSSMSKEALSRWNDFVALETTLPQQMLLLNFAYASKTGKDLDFLFEQVTDEIAEELIELIENNRDMSTAITKLSKEEVEYAQKLMDEKKFEEALVYVYSKSK